MLIHPFAPVFDKNSRVLILGTFPSPKSRENGFYYGHPQNAFWKTLALVLSKPEPEASTEARRAFLLENRVAVWDVLRSCDIEGASDMTIRNPVANDFEAVLKGSEIRTVFTTGKKATALWASLCAGKTGIEAVYLPSTSPANRAAWSRPGYLDAWSAVRCALE